MGNFLNPAECFVFNDGNSNNALTTAAMLNGGMREGNYGMREYPEYPMMGERDGYGYGERRGVPGTGRYSRY